MSTVVVSEPAAGPLDTVGGMNAGSGRILIAGAGDLGLGLAARLIADGRSVTTLNRSGGTVDGAESILADLGRPESMTGLPAFDTVVFTTAPPGRDEAAYRLAYVDGPRNLFAGLATPPRHVVLTSTTGVYGVDDGSWVDEATPAEPTRATAAAVREGEHRLFDMAPTSVLRPAGIYGPGRTGLQDRVRAGEAPIARDGTPRWTNRVHRDDVVEALRTLVSHPDPPPVVIAVDDEPVPRDDVVRWLAERLDAPEPDAIDIDRVTGKRCRNSLLRSLGWEPQYPNFRNGYEALLA